MALSTRTKVTVVAPRRGVDVAISSGSTVFDLVNDHRQLAGEFDTTLKPLGYTRYDSPRVVLLGD